MKNSKASMRVTGLALMVALALMVTACQEPSGQAVSSAQPVASSPIATTAGNTPQHSLLTAYAPGAVPFKPLPNCNVERLNGNLFGAQPSMLNSAQANTITGWVDPAGVAEPKIWLRFDDAQAKRYLHVPIQLTIERPDVQTSDLGAPRVSGFELQLPASALPTGQYHVYIAMISGDAAHVCDNGRHIEVES